MPGLTHSMPCTLSVAEMASRLAPSFKWQAAWFRRADFLQPAEDRSLLDLYSAASCDGDAAV